MGKIQMSYELISESTPVARKNYRCDWCGEMIVAGDKHYASRGKFEGELQFSRLHSECKLALNRLHAADPYSVIDGYEFHGFERGTVYEAGSLEGIAERSRLGVKSCIPLAEK